ncbi:unnamed protein product [Coffea canephora]|uniref:DH200=94 genomic scaffold, scaffold_1531 n=1 Tax=Coffea canephora TaxID=49390 RepID=A0A068VIS9_COFCA|nr:unnamed protein product [Coffea canephora]
MLCIYSGFHVNVRVQVQETGYVYFSFTLLWGLCQKFDAGSNVVWFFILLQIFTWMEAKERSRMSAADHAMRLELTIKVHTVGEAEEYFETLPDTVSKKAACLHLLHSYVKEKSADKAEALMQKMNSLGLIVNPHPFNEMMKLYIATSQHKKVLAVIVQMKQNRIPRNALSYNLWMNACAELFGVGSAEEVYKEMIHDKNVVIGWSSLSTLANIYQKSGVVNQAFWALREAENKLCSFKRLGYLFLSTIYTSLNRKDEVVRLWKASKEVKGRITCANYMCIFSCLVKLGHIKEAENIFLEWESQCRTFDMRVPNILLGAYMKRAESLFIRSLNRGGCHSIFKGKCMGADLASYLYKNRIVYLGMSSLVPSVTELILAEFHYLQYEDEQKPIYPYINSTGTTKDGEKLGYETEAFAIYDVMG